jgi:2,3-bisphosphoglycerate-dependent phosphoglycerate mutase
MQDAHDLVKVLQSFEPAAIYSSPYLRAIQTVQPVADSIGKSVTAIEEFKEHRMAPHPISYWREVLGQQWADFDHAHEGGESMNSTGARAWDVLHGLQREHPDETVLLAGHGTIISIVLNKLEITVGFDFHLAMPNPAVYVLSFDETGWQWKR